MTEQQCPKCGAPRQPQHLFCPSCGFSYEKKKKSVKPVAKSGKNPVREIVIIAVAVILTAVVYAAVSSMMHGGKPEAAKPETMAGKPMLQDLVQAGNDYMDHQVWDKAIAQYEQALMLDTLQPDVMVDLGACYHAIGENEKAAFQFQRALKQNPRHQIALFNLGIVAMTIGDTAGARSWWTKYLAVGTDSQQVKMVREQLSKL